MLSATVGVMAMATTRTTAMAANRTEITLMNMTQECPSPLTVRVALRDGS